MATQLENGRLYPDFKKIFQKCGLPGQTNYLPVKEQGEHTGSPWGVKFATKYPIFFHPTFTNTISSRNSICVFLAIYNGTKIGILSKSVGKLAQT